MKKKKVVKKVTRWSDIKDGKLSKAGQKRADARGKKMVKLEE